MEKRPHQKVTVKVLHEKDEPDWNIPDEVEAALIGKEAVKLCPHHHKPERDDVDACVLVGSTWTCLEREKKQKKEKEQEVAAR